MFRTLSLLNEVGNSTASPILLFYLMVGNHLPSADLLAYFLPYYIETKMASSYSDVRIAQSVIEVSDYKSYFNHFFFPN